ncbi:mucin/porimin [Holotrichia oblita]|uniref:Mucin/porimin n=1 Tax=Holotrichia oblita TaxID=644536 RepID=A0ACB9SVU7_HOLOL|nr:mucin/porimin [Holotrichia oblita]
MTTNPERTIMINHVVGLTKTAFDAVPSRQNTLSGFNKTDIHPFNPQIFSADDFLVSSVTDRVSPSPSTEGKATLDGASTSTVTPMPTVHSIPTTSAATINKARDNDIAMFTLQAHTSHKLQLLDRDVLDPFTTYCLLNNPGTVLNIYEATATMDTFSLTNIISGFSTEIYFLILTILQA